LKETSDEAADRQRVLNKGKEPARLLVYLIVRQRPALEKTKSYPMQDEPEGKVRFQYKMSLKGMAC
jgi:hypothetical protein